jgi:hypothetical protein
MNLFEEGTEKKEADEWQKDETDEDADVVKLEVNQEIQGMLVDKFDSVKYSCGIYKIKVKDDERIKIILGTTLLDKMMAKREIGEIVKVKRLEDATSGAGRSYQNYEVLHKKAKDENPQNELG